MGKVDRRTPAERVESVMRTYRRRRDAGLCVKCEAPSNGELHCETCREYRAAVNRRYHERQRRAAFERYGGAVCVCCGETTEAFLSLDHIDGGGNEHRREIAAGDGSSNFYVWIKKAGYPPGFQVMCQNCNVGKFRNGGICPHQAVAA